MKKTVLFSVVIASLLQMAAFSQDQKDLLDPKVRDILLEGINGDSAKEHVAQISKYHRVQASQGYRDAANYVLEKLKSYGFSEADAYVESFKSDGKISYQTWQSPAGWNIEKAELDIVEPVEEKIVSYSDIPMSLMTYSNPGDATAEVVWVGSGTNDSVYKDKNVKGKIVLATGSGEDVHRLAVVKYGAKFVVNYPDDRRGRENPDMIRYTGIWPRTEELKKVTFGFNISNKQGDKIRSLIESGKKVVLRGKVEGNGLGEFSLDVVVAHIRGKAKPADELVFSAHLDHPKECANDNGSGSGAILDIARAYKQLITSGKLPQPKRSFRFLWVPEWYGTMAYIEAHPELAGTAENGKFLANINMDMVGENLELLHSKLYVVQAPRSVPSCLNDVVENMTLMVDRLNITTAGGSKSQFNFRFVPYSGGSDHMMFLDRKIPAVMLGHSDYTHHSTLDSPDKVDPAELERCEMIAAGSLWFLAELNNTQGIDLIELHRANAYKRLGELARSVRYILNSASLKQLPIKWAETMNIVESAFNYEVGVAKSILSFNDSPEIFNPVSQSESHFGKRFEHLFVLTREVTESNGYASDYPPPLCEVPDRRVPVRLTRGPLDFRLPASKLAEKDALWYNSPDFPLNESKRFELVNFIDGNRTAEQIFKALTAEFPAASDTAVSRYLNDLVKAGVIRWKDLSKE